LAFALRRLLCQQQRNEIMKEFLSLVKSVSYLFALSRLNYFTTWHAAPSGLISAFAPTSSLPSNYRNAGVNPDLSVVAKPATITSFLQILQPASA